MLKNILFFAILLILGIVFFGRPGGGSAGAATVEMPRAQLYAALNRDFGAVEVAAAQRSARQDPDIAPLTVHVTREEGRVLDLRIESQGKTAQVRVSLNDTGNPTTTGLQITTTPAWPMQKAAKLKPVEKVEWILLMAAAEISDSPEVTLLRDRAPSEFELTPPTSPDHTS